jgi:hypothetical protein
MASQTTLLTDTLTGVAGTALTAHTANSGNTWTALSCASGTIALDGNGYLYDSAGAGTPLLYKASGTFPQNQTVTYTATFNMLSDHNYSGIGVVDASGNGYQLASYNSGFTTGGGFGVERFTANWITSCGSSGTLTSLARSSVFTPSGLYTATFTFFTTGTTVTMTVTVKQAGATVWASGNIVDSSYPLASQLTVRGYSVSPDSASTGHHAGNLSAAYTVQTSLAASPALVAASSTGNTITLTGTGTAWTPGSPGAPAFTASAGTITAQTVNSTTSATLTFTAPPGSVAITFTDPSTGRTAVINTYQPVTSAAWYFSPYGWYSDGGGALQGNNIRGGSTYALSNNPGNYFKALFSGTSAALVMDETINSGTMPVVKWSIDGSAYQTHTLTGSETSFSLVSGLASANHTLVLYLVAAAISQDRWNTPAQAIKIKGIQLDSAASLQPLSGDVAQQPANLLCFGDSQTEGLNVNGSGGATTTQDAQLGPCSALGRALGAEYGVVAFSCQGWTVGGCSGSNVPTFPNAWNFFYSSHSRLIGGQLAPAPAFIWELEGINDGGASTSSAVAAWLPAIRAAAGPATPIFLGVPWSQAQAANIQAAAATAADPFVHVVNLGPLYTLHVAADGATRDSYDGQHPNAAAVGWLMSMTAKAIQSMLGAWTGSVVVQ